MEKMQKKKDFSKFEERLGFTFNNQELLKMAFTHRSWVNENRREGREHNERLEFLGDAVLELAITRFLYDKYPDKPEGELTAYRAALVNTSSIATAAGELSMNEFLQLSRGESNDTGRARHFILANAFEALIGAIYLDRGFEIAEKFIGVMLYDKIEDVVKKKLWQDAKSHFQEVAQERVGVTPNYKLKEESGPDHDKRFVVGVFLNDEQVALGSGKSKQEAEQAAAAKAVEVKNW